MSFCRYLDLDWRKIRLTHLAGAPNDHPFPSQLTTAGFVFVFILLVQRSLPSCETGISLSQATFRVTFRMRVGAGPSL